MSCGRTSGGGFRFPSGLRMSEENPLAARDSESPPRGGEYQVRPRARHAPPLSDARES
jgi:hypothetical protein